MGGKRCSRDGWVGNDARALAARAARARDARAARARHGRRTPIGRFKSLELACAHAVGACPSAGIDFWSYSLLMRRLYVLCVGSGANNNLRSVSA